jgi:TolA-binding protein
MRFLKKHYLTITILLIFLISAVGIAIWLKIDNTKDSATELFEEADKLLQDYNEMNIESKKINVDSTITALDKVVFQYPATTSGKRAQYYKGYVYFNAFIYDKAIKEYRIFIANYKKHYLISRAYYDLSYCYEFSDDLDNAIKTLTVFENELKKSYLAPTAILRIGYLYHKKEDNEKALNYYQKVIDEYPESKQKSVAEKRLLVLKNDIKFLDSEL